MSHAGCEILFQAGKALVEKSGLAHYSDPCFVACDNKARFDEHWGAAFHPEFGRYMAWVLFSVGAENLAKAACVCNGVVKVSHKPSLEHYVDMHFKELCSKPRLCDSDDENRLIEGYERLKNVRNRDAHSYRRNVRDADFPLVEQTFVPAFDTVVKVMRNGGHPHC